MKKCTYKDGELDGTYEEYDKNGDLLGKYTYKDGKYKAPCELFRDKYPRRFTERCTFTDGSLGVSYEVYHDNGRLWKKYTYKDGKPVGPYEEYYDNGKLYKKYTYKDGKKQGPYERYYDDGQLWEKGTYTDGKEDGPIEWYRNGRLSGKGVCRMGKRLYEKEAEEYLKEWTKKEARKGLNARLAQMNKHMAPTQLRQTVKRAEVAEFRKNHPDKHAGRIISNKKDGHVISNKKDGRVIKKKNWLQKLFRGGR